MDIESFLSDDKSMIIAPAGYGKTHTIAEAIAHYGGNKKILVLTHTHAGIASLKQKFEDNNIPAIKYHLDTICSFALDLTKTYHINKDEIPDESDTTNMFAFAIEHATIILRARPIKQFLKSKYAHLIVDEYQDCTVAQHKMILGIAKVLKTHILGDPLQGIFGFRNESLIDFESDDFMPFMANVQTLETPWRWNNAGKESLGRDLLLIRENLIRNEDIDLNDYPSIEKLIAHQNDFTQSHSQYKSKIFNALREDSVLLIHPRSETPASRVRFIQQFPALQMIESIDDSAFYKYCESFDKLTGQQLISAVVQMMRSLAKSSAVEVWFNKHDVLKRKDNDEDNLRKHALMQIIEPLMAEKTYGKIVDMIDAIKNLPGVKVYRKEMMRDICRALKDAELLGITALKAIEHNRNIARRKGRKIYGKGIGTTLLTKGLEFNTVVVLNAHQFRSPKHLYVALTRCCKRLIVISESAVLHPY